MRSSRWVFTFFCGFCGGLFAWWLLRTLGLLRSAPPRFAVAHPVAPPVIALLAPPHCAEDIARADFLRRLDGGRVGLSDWEAGFLESNIGRVCYSMRQRVVIDGMRRRYGRWL